MNFASRRSTVVCRNGCVASSQPLASQIGVDILKMGGNAADAAVAVAAALSVTEPCCTGIGGDAFCLFYDANVRKVRAMNASGRTPSALTLTYLRSLGYDRDRKFPPTSPLSITVPGACAGWVDCVEKFGSGKLSLGDILGPAIELARSGFPVSGPVTSHEWAQAAGPLLADDNSHGSELLVKDESGAMRAPRTGQVFRNPGLADVLDSVADRGKAGFYGGWVADAVVRSVQRKGGVLGLDDLAAHTTTFDDPMCVEYKGYHVWETQPNSQGIVALQMLSILKNFDVGKLGHNTGEYLHLLIEAARLSFADASEYCCDPAAGEGADYRHMISDEYGRERAQLIRLDGDALDVCMPGKPPLGGGVDGDTVYFACADAAGNHCSFINSNYTGFGTGIVPPACGFSLHNRACLFTLEGKHRNRVAPGKRPYHTIIPGMVTDARSGEVVMSYGVMGGVMQPQGHVQVLLNMCEFGMDPQQALDAPRFLVGSGHLSSNGHVHLERGIPSKACDLLARRGHVVRADVAGHQRAMFGRGQVIASRRFWDDDDAIGGDGGGVLWAGSDPRADGCAIGY